MEGDGSVPKALEVVATGEYRKKKTIPVFFRVCLFVFVVCVVCVLSVFVSWSLSRCVCQLSLSLASVCFSLPLALSLFSLSCLISVSPPFVWSLCCSLCLALLSVDTSFLSPCLPLPPPSRCLFKSFSKAQTGVVEHFFFYFTMLYFVLVYFSFLYFPANGYK